MKITFDPGFGSRERLQAEAENDFERDALKAAYGWLLEFQGKCSRAGVSSERVLGTDALECVVVHGVREDLNAFLAVLGVKLAETAVKALGVNKEGTPC
jgi:hypothetical protein